MDAEHRLHAGLHEECEMGIGTKAAVCYQHIPGAHVRMKRDHLSAYSTDFCHSVHENVATQSRGFLPLSPEDFCHSVHGMLPPAERSDAGSYE